MATKSVIAFHPAESPIRSMVTKFGGQPVWVAEPAWPVSRETGNPMRFICQVQLNDVTNLTTQASMAYVFMTDEENGEFVDGTYEPDSGENAVVLQSGHTPVAAGPDGPTLYRLESHSEAAPMKRVPCEFSVQLSQQADVDFLPEEQLFKLPEEQWDTARGVLDENKLGGSPVFLQGDEFPFATGSQLLLQIDAGRVPFEVNFGDMGIGYAFLNADGTEAKFLWQCS